MTSRSGPPFAPDLEADEPPHETIGERHMPAQDAATYVYVIEASGEVGALGVFADPWDAVDAVWARTDVEEKYIGDAHAAGIIARFKKGSSGEITVRRVPVVPAGGSID